MESSTLGPTGIRIPPEFFTTLTKANGRADTTAIVVLGYLAARPDPRADCRYATLALTLHLRTPAVRSACIRLQKAGLLKIQHLRGRERNHTWLDVNSEAVAALLQGGAQ